MVASAVQSSSGTAEPAVLKGVWSETALVFRLQCWQLMQRTYVFIGLLFGIACQLALPVSCASCGALKAEEDVSVAVVCKSIHTASMLSLKLQHCPANTVHPTQT